MVFSPKEVTTDEGNTASEESNLNLAILKSGICSWIEIEKK